MSNIKDSQSTIKDESPEKQARDLARKDSYIPNSVKIFFDQSNAKTSSKTKDTEEKNKGNDQEKQ